METPKKEAPVEEKDGSSSSESDSSFQSRNNKNNVAQSNVLLSHKLAKLASTTYSNRILVVPTEVRGQNEHTYRLPGETKQTLLQILHEI
jgi:hypothetical protein